MEFPVLFKNVFEEHANDYIKDEGDSKIIGFVNPKNESDKFGYILAGGKQYGASYNDIVKIAQENGGTNIVAQNSSFIGAGDVTYTINISDGKLTVSQYKQTIVEASTYSVPVTTSCFENSTGNASTEVIVGETYCCYLRIVPNKDSVQRLAYSIKNSTQNKFVITGIASIKNGITTNSYVFGGSGRITKINGVFTFTPDSNTAINYITDASISGYIAIPANNPELGLISVAKDYSTPQQLNDGNTLNLSLSIDPKKFTIYVHEKGLNSFITNTLTLKASTDSVTYTVKPSQHYYYTAKDITVTDTNNIKITDNNSNGDITYIKVLYNQKPSKFIIKNEGSTNISPKFLYPKGWGTAYFYNGPFKDSNWKLKGVYNVSTSKGSSQYKEYNYLYFGDIITPGSTGDWDIKW